MISVWRQHIIQKYSPHIYKNFELHFMKKKENTQCQFLDTSEENNKYQMLISKNQNSSFQKSQIPQKALKEQVQEKRQHISSKKTMYDSYCNSLVKIIQQKLQKNEDSNQRIKYLLLLNELIHGMKKIIWHLTQILPYLYARMFMMYSQENNQRVCDDMRFMKKLWTLKLSEKVLVSMRYFTFYLCRKQTDIIKSSENNKKLLQVLLSNRLTSQDRDKIFQRNLPRMEIPKQTQIGLKSPILRRIVKSVHQKKDLKAKLQQEKRKERQTTKMIINSTPQVKFEENPEEKVKIEEQYEKKVKLQEQKNEKMKQKMDKLLKMKKQFKQQLKEEEQSKTIQIKVQLQQQEYQTKEENINKSLPQGQWIMPASLFNNPHKDYNVRINMQKVNQKFEEQAETKSTTSSFDEAMKTANLKCHICDRKLIFQMEELQLFIKSCFYFEIKLYNQQPKIDHITYKLFKNQLNTLKGEPIIHYECAEEISKKQLNTQPVIDY